MTRRTGTILLRNTRITGTGWGVPALLAVLVMGTAWAGAGPTGGSPVTLKVLSAKSESLSLNAGSNDVPTDCNLMDYSAYCIGGRTTAVRNTMLVRDNDGKSFTISCTVDARFSNCVSLPVGETVGAQSEKHGFTVWYRNAKGKEVKQAYSLVAQNGEFERTSAPAAAAAPSQNSSAEAPVHSAAAPATAAVPPTPAVPATPAGPTTNRDTVKCNFTSTPAGAEITIDGRYAGNTPSTIAVSPGAHSIVLSLSGFGKWQRELSVSTGSELNITATLQKMQ